MRQRWITRIIGAPAPVVWHLLTEPRLWSSWGPSVRRIETHSPGPVAQGTTGTVVTVVGLCLPFEVTDFDDGHRWRWTVAGITATDHRVEPLGPERCRAGFGVPWPASPYLAVCLVALRRIEVLATEVARSG